MMRFQMGQILYLERLMVISTSSIATISILGEVITKQAALPTGQVYGMKMGMTMFRRREQLPLRGMNYPWLILLETPFRGLFRSI